MSNLLQSPIKLITHWHTDELLGETLANILIEQTAELERWEARPERLLQLHAGPFGNLGEGLVYQDPDSDFCQKVSGLRFAKLVLRKNTPGQYDTDPAGWHVHAFYPVPQLPLNWTGDRNFRYLTQHMAGYFVSGIESEGDGATALAADLKIAAEYAPAQLPHLVESLEPLVQQLWPLEVAATFWQEQLNRPLRDDYEALALLSSWGRQMQTLIENVKGGHSLDVIAGC